MAIPSSQLHLRYGNASLQAESLLVGWEVYHAQTDTVIESGSVSVSIGKPLDFPAAWDKALGLTDSRAALVFEKHKPVGAIGGYSLFDADLILDQWLSDQELKILTHPISGDFEDVSYGGIVDLINEILVRVIGPPVWFWAESAQAGRLGVKCVAVPGATSYNVYDGTELLGTISNPAGSILTVPAGSYSVRIAAVNNGQIGICSFPVPVTVS